jgi:myo-inositol-1(or 4)-monophosphatase
MSYLETAAGIARQAGDVILHYLAEGAACRTKGKFDLVTEADHASEKLIVEALCRHYPTHTIVAEEGGGQQGTSEYRWFVDPLDGTTNFAHGFPAFNVTLGLERAGEKIVGVVFVPLHQELFTAERGAGAYLNGTRLHVSPVRRIADSLSSTGFPSRKPAHNVNIHHFYQLAMMSHGVRRTGAAAIDLAYVAAGRLDFYWEFGLKPWDMAAGLLMVEEAGGRYSTMSGAPHDLTGSDDMLASNGLLHDEVVAEFASIAAGHVRTPLPEYPGAGSQRHRTEPRV